MMWDEHNSTGCWMEFVFFETALRHPNFWSIFKKLDLFWPQDMSILILGQIFNFQSIFASTLTNFFYIKIYAFHSKIMECCAEQKFSFTCFCTFQTLSKSILNNLRVFFLFEGYSKLIPSKGLQVMQKCSKWRDKSSKNTIKMKLVDFDEKIGWKWNKWSKSKIDMSCGQNKSNFLKIGQTLGCLRAISKKTYSIQHPVYFYRHIETSSVSVV